MDKKGQQAFGFEAVIGIVLIIGVAGIIAGFVLNVQSDVRDDFTADTLEYNATTDSMTGVSNLSSKFPILGLIGAAIVIIAALFLLVRAVRTR